MEKTFKIILGLYCIAKVFEKCVMIFCAIVTAILIIKNGMNNPQIGLGNAILFTVSFFSIPAWMVYMHFYRRKKLSAN